MIANEGRNAKITMDEERAASSSAEPKDPAAVEAQTVNPEEPKE